MEKKLSPYFDTNKYETVVIKRDWRDYQKQGDIDKATHFVTTALLDNDIFFSVDSPGRFILISKDEKRHSFLKIILSRDPYNSSEIYDSNFKFHVNKAELEESFSNKFYALVTLDKNDNLDKLIVIHADLFSSTIEKINSADTVNSIERLAITLSDIFGTKVNEINYSKEYNEGWTLVKKILAKN